MAEPKPTFEVQADIEAQVQSDFDKGLYGDPESQAAQDVAETVRSANIASQEAAYAEMVAEAEKADEVPIYVHDDITFKEDEGYVIGTPQESEEYVERLAETTEAPVIQIEDTPEWHDENYVFESEDAYAAVSSELKTYTNKLKSEYPDAFAEDGIDVVGILIQGGDPEDLKKAGISSSDVASAMGQLHQYRQESARIVKENKRIEEENRKALEQYEEEKAAYEAKEAEVGRLLGKYDVYTTKSGINLSDDTTVTSMDLTTLSKDVYKAEGMTGLSELRKDLKTIGYAPEVIKDSYDKALEVVQEDRSARLAREKVEALVGTNFSSDAIAAALRQPGVTVKTFTDAKFNKEDIEILDKYKDYYTPDGLDQQEVIRSGKFKTSELKKDLGITQQSISAEQSRLLVDNAGGLTNYLQQNPGPSGRATVVQAQFTDDKGNLLTNITVREYQNLAKHMKADGTVNVSDLVEDTRINESTLRRMDPELADTYVGVEEYLKLEKAVEVARQKTSDDKMPGWMAGFIGGSLAEGDIKMAPVDTSTNLPMAISDKAIVQNIDISSLGIEEGSPRHAELTRLSNSGAGFLLDLVPVVGTARLVVKSIRKEGGGFEAPTLKELAWIGGSTALDVVTIITLGRGSIAAAEAKPLITGAGRQLLKQGVSETGERTIISVNNLGELTQQVSKLPFHMMGFGAKVVSAPVRVPILLGKNVSKIPQAVQGAISTVKKGPGAYLEQMAKLSDDYIPPGSALPQRAGAPARVSVGPPISYVPTGGTRIIPGIVRPREVAEVGRTLVDLGRTRAQTIISSPRKELTEMVTSPIKGIGKALGDGWSAPTTSVLRQSGSDIAVAVWRPGRTLSETKSVIMGRKLLTNADKVLYQRALAETSAEGADELARIIQGKLGTDEVILSDIVTPIRDPDTGRLLAKDIETVDDVRNKGFIPVFKSSVDVTVAPSGAEIVVPSNLDLVGYRSFTTNTLGDRYRLVFEKGPRGDRYLEITERVDYIPQDDLGPATVTKPPEDYGASFDDQTGTFYRVDEDGVRREVDQGRTVFPGDIEVKKPLQIPERAPEVSSFTQIGNKGLRIKSDEVDSLLPDERTFSIERVNAEGEVIEEGTVFAGPFEGQKDIIEVDIGLNPTRPGTTPYTPGLEKIDSSEYTAVFRVVKDTFPEAKTVTFIRGTDDYTGPTDRRFLSLDRLARDTVPTTITGTPRSPGDYEDVVLRGLGEGSPQTGGTDAVSSSRFINYETRRGPSAYIPEQSRMSLTSGMTTVAEPLVIPTEPLTIPTRPIPGVRPDAPIEPYQPRVPSQQPIPSETPIIPRRDYSPSRRSREIPNPGDPRFGSQPRVTPLSPGREREFGTSGNAQEFRVPGEISYRQEFQTPESGRWQSPGEQTRASGSEQFKFSQDPARGPEQFGQSTPEDATSGRFSEDYELGRASDPAEGTRSDYALDPASQTAPDPFSTPEPVKYPGPTDTPVRRPRTDPPTRRRSRVRPPLPRLGAVPVKEAGTTVLLSIASSPRGSGRGVPKTRRVTVGDSVTVRATPNKGWVFDHWEGDVPPGFVSRQQFNLDVEDDTELLAVFIKGSKKKGETYIHSLYPTALKSKKHTEVARLKGV